MLELGRRKSLVQPLNYAACCASTVDITQVQHKGTVPLFTGITSSSSNCTGTSKYCSKVGQNTRMRRRRGGQKDMEAQHSVLAEVRTN